MADNEKAEKVELISLPVEVFSDFVGNRVSRDKKITGTNYKISCNLPVPATTKEVAEMYGIAEDEVLAIAVKQISYARDTEVAKYLKEKAEAGTDWENADTELAEAGEIFQRDLSTPPERKVSQKTAEAKAVKAENARMKSILAKLGIESLEDINDAMLAKMAKKVAK